MFLVPLVAVALLFAAACGDDEDGNTAATETPPVTETATPAASPTASESPTEANPTQASSPTEAATATPTEGTCTITTTADVTAYTRPSAESDVFGTIPAGDSHEVVSGVTAEGWVGFVPAVAQAANIGPFRSRFIEADGAYELTGDCESLAVLPTLPVACFTMAIEDFPVRAAPNPDAEAVFEVASGDDYAEVTDSIENEFGTWLEVEGWSGDGEGQTGWMSADFGNFNGPCDDFTA